MTEAEQPPEAPKPDNASQELARRIPPWLQDEVGVFVKKYDLTPEDGTRLLDSGVDALASGITVPEAFDRALAENSDILFKAGRGALSEHLLLRESWHYDVILLFAAQIDAREILPPKACFYLAFGGGISHGKSEGVEATAILSDAEFYAGGSPAALRDTFGSGKVVAIDELDSLLDKSPDLAGILRSGNRWDAKYRLNFQTKGGWEAKTVPVGGPKVFSFHAPPEDDATLSRTIVLEPGGTVEGRIVTQSFFPENPLLPFSRHFHRVLGARVAQWSKDRVESRMKNPSFIERLERFPAELGRDRQLTAILLILSEICGLDADRTIREASMVQSESHAENDEFFGILAEFYRARRPADSVGDLTVRQSDLLAFINERRLAVRLSPWPAKSRQLRAALKEAGFVDGRSVRRRAVGRYLTFDTELRKRIRVDEQVNTECQPAEPGSWQEGPP